MQIPVQMMPTCPSLQLVVLDTPLVTIILYQEYIYKEGEGECRTAHMPYVTAVPTVHDLCNDIHV